MPKYMYQRADNKEVVELIMSISEMERRQFDGDGGQYIKLDDGVLAQRLWTPVGGQLPQNWPLVSTAAGVGADQIREAMAIDRKAGIQTDYTPDGDVIFKSPGHRRNWLREHRMFDRKAYY